MDLRLTTWSIGLLEWNDWRFYSFEQSNQNGNQSGHQKMQWSNCWRTIWQAVHFSLAICVRSYVWQARTKRFEFLELIMMCVDTFKLYMYRISLHFVQNGLFSCFRTGFFFFFSTRISKLGLIHYFCVDFVYIFFVYAASVTFLCINYILLFCGSFSLNLNYFKLCV